MYSGLAGCVLDHFHASNLQMHARQGHLIVSIVLRHSQMHIFLFLF